MRKMSTAQTGQEPTCKATRTRRKTPPLTKSRKALLTAYKATYDEIPTTMRCAACGAHLNRDEAERHHPAGRRKAAFLFTIMVHRACHERIHHDPQWANDCALLWPGRNSKTLTQAAAETLVMKMPFPPLYAINILKKHQTT